MNLNLTVLRTKKLPFYFQKHISKYNMVEVFMKNINIRGKEALNGAKSSRIDQVKLVEDSL